MIVISWLIMLALIISLITLTVILFSSLASAPKVDKDGDEYDSFAEKVKRNKKKYFKCIVVLGSILILILCYKGIDLLAFEYKSSFTTEGVKYAANRIYKQNMGFESSVNVRLWEEKNTQKSLERYFGFFALDNELKKDGSIFISNSGGDSWLTPHLDPTEITAAFECILYFNEKTLPGLFIGVANAQSKGAMSSFENMTFISVTECAEMCQQVDITGLSRRKAAKKLAEAWIEKHNYVKK